MSDELEDTERSRILDLVRSEFDFPVVGEVTAVHPHTGNEDTPSNHEVDVQVPPGPNPTESYDRRPVVAPTSGVVATPEKDDLVVLVFPKRSAKPYVIGTVYGDKPEDRAPGAAEDTVRVTRGDLYLELAGDGSTGRIAKKSADMEDPTAKVEIDDQGAVSIETDGDITVSAGGDVVIDEGGEAEKVARQNHTHPYSWTDAGGSGNTGTPNENGTKTEIE